MTDRIRINFACRRRGFTLIELAIVLLIVGILMGVGSGMVGMLYSSIRLRQTRDSMDDNVQAIASWASANNKLPQLSGFTSTVAKTQMDASTRPLVYLYYSSIAPATATKDTICGRRTTSLTVQNSSPTTTTISNVAYVILSGGESSAATTLSTLTGTLLGATYTNQKIPRPASSGTAVGGYASGTINVDPTSTDIIRWVTLDELRSKIGCQGAPLKIVTNELPYGYNQITYNAVVYADGGVPYSSGGAYKWCLQNSLLTTNAPAGMTFKSVGGTNVPFSANCSTLADGSWTQSDNLVIAGTGPVITVFGSSTSSYISLQPHTATAANAPHNTTYWGRAASVVTGPTWQTTAASGFYYPTTSNALTVYVRDNNDPSTPANDNSVYKVFAFTVNPQ